MHQTIQPQQATQMPKIFNIEDKLFARKGCKPMEVFRECFPDIAVDTSWKTIRAKIKLVARRYLYDCIDKEIIKAICNYAIKKDANEDECNCLEVLRIAVANWVAFELSKTNGWLSDQGLVESNGSGKTKPVDRLSHNETKYNFKDCACDATEELIFDCIIPNIKSFPAQEESKVYKKFCSLLISSPEIFTQYEAIAKPGRYCNWICLLPFMLQAEEELQEKILCDKFFCKLAEMFKECTDPKQQKLRNLIQRYIATRTLLIAAQSTTLLWTGDGYKTIDRHTGSKTLGKNWVDCNREQLETKDDKNLNRILKFLEENKECFPEYLKCCTPIEEPCDACECYPCECVEEDNEGCDSCGQHRCGCCPDPCAPPPTNCAIGGKSTALIGF